VNQENIFHYLGENSPFPKPTKSGGGLRRGMAFLIDLVLIFLIWSFFLWLAVSAVRLAVGEGDVLGDTNLFFGPISFTIVFLGPFLFIFYFSFLTWWGGQTIGKKLLRLKITDRAGGAVSMIQSLGRTMGYFFSFLSGGLGFVIMFFSRERRSLHDRISGTSVVVI